MRAADQLEEGQVIGKHAVQVVPREGCDRDEVRVPLGRLVPLNGAEPRRERSRPPLCRVASDLACRRLFNMDRSPGGAEDGESRDGDNRQPDMTTAFGGRH